MSYIVDTKDGMVRSSGPLPEELPSEDVSRDMRKTKIGEKIKQRSQIGNKQETEESISPGEQESPQHEVVKTSTESIGIKTKSGKWFKPPERYGW